MSQCRGGFVEAQDWGTALAFLLAEAARLLRSARMGEASSV
jgi:hypothetical protein